MSGHAATVYTVHTENEGSVSDNKVWLSARGLVLKSEIRIQGLSGVTLSTFDYSHAEPPKDATPVGAK